MIKLIQTLQKNILSRNNPPAKIVLSNIFIKFIYIYISVSSTMTALRGNEWSDETDGNHPNIFIVN